MEAIRHTRSLTSAANAHMQQAARHLDPGAICPYADRTMPRLPNIRAV